MERDGRRSMAEIDIGRRRFLTGVSTGVVGTLVATSSASLLTGDAGAAKTAEPPGDPALIGPDKVLITLDVNGTRTSLAVEPRATLLDTLRDKLDLTGAKRVCDRGECGACTVIVDGRPVYSCLTLAVMTDSKKVETVEGLREGEKLHPVQEAFLKCDAYQCGFCTPGQIMAAKALLDANPHPTMDEIKSGMSGNLCRCSAYVKIFDAVATASKMTA
jgi:xanthine dehydrogenase YagT iron-sulfur-binding subunit